MANYKLSPFSRMLIFMTFLSGIGFTIYNLYVNFWATLGYGLLLLLIAIVYILYTNEEFKTALKTILNSASNRKKSPSDSGEYVMMYFPEQEKKQLVDVIAFYNNETYEWTYEDKVIDPNVIMGWTKIENNGL